MVNSQKSGFEQMFAQFLNVTGQFTATLEDMHKKELMVASSKTASKSLDYDEMQPSSRGRPQQFTPQCMGTQLISESPEDFDLEAESMTSQSSRTAPTRLMEKFDVIGIKSKSEFTNEQINTWIAEHAKAEMAKGGEYEDLGIIPLFSSGNVIFFQRRIPHPIGGLKCPKMQIGLKRD